MALTQQNALVSLSMSASPVVSPQASGAVFTVLSGSTVTFSLQSTNLVDNWTVSIASDNASIHGKSLTWNPGQPNALTFTPPVAPSAITYTSTVSDGNSSYASVSGTINVVWVDGERTLMASWFGAVGNGSFFGAGIATGADDTAALQAMLDYNPAVSVGPNSGFKARINVSPYKTPLGQSIFPYSAYRISRPLQLNDGVINGTTTIEGDALQSTNPSVGLLAYDYIGPQIVGGQCGTSVDSPQYLMDPSGTGIPMVQCGQALTGTLDSSMNGLSLPQSTIKLSGTNPTQGFAFAGKIAVTNSALVVQKWITYTGKTATSFTGCTGGTGMLATGGAVSAPQGPIWNLSDTRIGDLTGVNSFTFECWINVGDSTAWILANQPGNFVSSPFGSSGRTGNVEVSRDSFYVIDYSPNAGVRALQFFLTTTSATYQLQTSASADHSWGAATNVTHHFAVQWDGTNLDMWIDGVRPSGAGDTCHLTTAGTLAQKDYEALTILSGQGREWPYRGDQASFQPWGPGSCLGPVRLSIPARYTSGPTITPPNPLTIVSDGTTRALFKFDAAHIPSRPTMLGYTIAETGQASEGSTAIMPVWLQNYCNLVVYKSNLSIRRLCFQGIGEGIHTFAMTNSEIAEDCFFFANDIGIVVDSFSYNSSIGKSCAFFLLGTSTASHNFLSCEIFLAGGTQFFTIKENGAGNFGSTNWGIISRNSDCTIHPRFPNQYIKGSYAFVQGISTIFLCGASMLDDLTAGYKLCGLLFCPQGGALNAALYWMGGYIGMGNSSVPIILIGNADTSPCPVEVNTTLFTSGVHTTPVFSFKGSADGTQPAIWGGANAGGNLCPILDVNNPGPVIDKRHVGHGEIPINVTGNTTLAVNNCLYGRMVFTGSPGSPTTQTQPCHIIGRQFTVLNSTTQALTYVATTGTGVSIPIGSEYMLYDDGTNITHRVLT